MLLFIGLQIFIAASQDSLVEVTYNDNTLSFSKLDLKVAKLKSIFNIQEFKFLEDLSGKKFYPYPDGSFPSSISSVVYVRQNPPAKVPTIIYPTESKFVHNKGSSLGYASLSVGYNTFEKHMRATFIQFKDYPFNQTEKKIEKAYLRLVGNWNEFPTPTQVFTHRIETEWEGIFNWSQQPIIREQPTSFRILGEVSQVPFLWDVTSIVLEWISGLLPSYGIALKTNDTYGIGTAKNFEGQNSVKKPCLLVYYSDK